MNDARIMSSIIPDGFHIDYAAVKIAEAVMGERLFAITDAVTTTNIGPYPHYLAGEKYESAGILSGSALTMNKALKNLVTYAGVSIQNALKMCSLYPARAFGISNKHGMIAPGFDTNLVVLDNELDVVELISS